jgi:hypothetical protein
MFRGSGSTSRPPFLHTVAAGALLAATLGAGIASPATAQSQWMPRNGDQTVMLEVLQPSLEGFDSELFSAAFFLSGRVALSPRLSVVGELPFARHKSTYFAFFPENLSSNTIGNPYAGVELKLGSGLALLELGVRPPLVADDELLASFTGKASDVARWEAFATDRFAILAAFRVREVTPSKIAFGFRLSPAFTIPTKETTQTGMLYAIYSFQVGYEGTKARIGTGLTGRSQITHEIGDTPLDFISAYGNLGQRTSSQFEVHADFLSGRIRPGLDLHVPLAGMSNYVSSVVGLSVTWTR